MIAGRVILLVVALSALISPSTTCHAQNCNIDSLKNVFDSRPTDPVEGVWQWSDDGAIIAVVRHSETDYRVVSVDSPSLNLPCGTVIGTISQSPKVGRYNASFHTTVNKKGKLTKPHKFEVEITPERTMSLYQYNTGARLSFWRWIPYLFRVTVEKGDKIKGGMDGPVKIYPMEAASTLNPVIL